MKSANPPPESSSPESQVEKEHPYVMNLITNREAVIAALIAMEGERWFKEQEGWGEYSIEGALAQSQSGSSRLGGVIYGLGGLHRYMVRANGHVYYSASHGQRAVEQAKALGFRMH